MNRKFVSRISLLSRNLLFDRLTLTRQACGKVPDTKLAQPQTDTNTSPNLQPQDSPNFCLNHVKKYDRENFFAALCIKDPIMRRIVFALRAFNVELSLIKDSTTNADRAKLRFHFWSKLVEEIVRRSSQTEPDVDKSMAYYKHTPIAKELLDMFDLVSLDSHLKKGLNDMIGARVSSKAMGQKLFDSMDDLELYCSKSNSSLYQLSWRIHRKIDAEISIDQDVMSTLTSVSNQLGIAQGMSNIIRGIPHNASRECCYIPKDILNQFELRPRDFIGNSIDGKKVEPIVKFLAERCQESLDEVQSQISKVPNQIVDIFLPRVAIESNLRRIKSSKYNICDPKLQSKNVLLPLNFWLASKSLNSPII